MTSLRALLLLLALLSAMLPAASFADETLTIAVASNFHSTTKEIASRFSDSTGIAVRLSSGSTGKLYAQIINGAPYDIFLAADDERPELLEKSGDAVAGSRITYAVGSLLLWSADPSLANQDCRDALERGDYRKLAIANPNTAPYGSAAQEFLQQAGLLEAAEDKLVYGESISQTLNFVATGNATLGLIATSQAAGELPVSATCSWPVPSELHSDLHQQAVILAASKKLAAARAFMVFLESAEVRVLLESQGYQVLD
jgi:molybdate transport system substrate-binding protein